MFLLSIRRSFQSMLLPRSSGWIISVWQEAYDVGGAEIVWWVYIWCATQRTAVACGRKSLLLGCARLGSRLMRQDRTAPTTNDDDDDDAIRHHQTRDLISNAFITTSSCSFSLAGHRHRSTTDGFPRLPPTSPRPPLRPARAAFRLSVFHFQRRRARSTSVYRWPRVKVGT